MLRFGNEMNKLQLDRQCYGKQQLPLRLDIRKCDQDYTRDFTGTSTFFGAASASVCGMMGIGGDDPPIGNPLADQMTEWPD